MTNMNPSFQFEAKISRNCDFDTFIDNVNRRSRLNSGLAIHRNIEQIPVEMYNPRISKTPDRSRTMTNRRNHKYDSNFYKNKIKEVQKKRFEASLPPPNKNLIARKEFENTLKSRLKKYQKELEKKDFSLQISLKEDVIDIPPNPEQIAEFRYNLFFKQNPEDHNEMTSDSQNL